MKSLAIFFLVSFQFAYGIDFDKCGENVFHKNIKKAGGWEGGVLMTAVAASTSSTQVTSSWGDCALIGNVKHDQKVFMAQTWESLQLDIAKGSGEFVDAFSEISKCNLHGRNVLRNNLKENFSKIYGSNFQNNLDQAHREIRNLMLMNSVIIKNCRFDI